jgi:hypothetical protein
MMSSNSSNGRLRGGIMIYMLEFLGLLVVAASLAASPVLVNLLERFFPQLDDETHAAPGYGLSGAMVHDRSEMRDEIRRVTNILETNKLNVPPGSKSAGGVDT